MSAGRSNLVLTRIDGAVATITLNRPQRHNSLVPELLAQLLDALAECNQHPEVGVIVLKAAGRSFSTGGDLHGFLEHAANLRDYSNRLVGLLNETIVAMVDARAPTVVAVDGQVTGGSLGLVLAADIAVVTPRASFTPYYVDVGFGPDGGWSVWLPDIVGRKRAAAVQLLNRTLSAEQAVAWGLAHELAGRNEIDTVIDELCAALLEKKPGSIRTTRRLLRPDDLEARLDAEKRRFVEQIATREAIEGMRAFLGAAERGE